jgi:hypothetical protein
MSFIQEIDAEAMAVLNTIEADGKQLGLLVWGEIKRVVGAVEQSVLAGIPGLVQKLQGYAAIVVQEIATDTQFVDAMGHWKFGLAAARVWALIKADFPPLEKIGASALQAAIETAIQAAFAALVTGL